MQEAVRTRADEIIEQYNAYTGEFDKSPAEVMLSGGALSELYTTKISELLTKLLLDKSALDRFWDVVRAQPASSVSVRAVRTTADMALDANLAQTANDIHARKRVVRAERRAVKV